MKKLVVLGSVNADHVLTVPSFEIHGHMIHEGSTFFSTAW